ncbi:Glycine betaine/L-proline transport system permease protein ProW [compost metagenome]
MIGAGGIGNIVLTGIQRLDVGTGFEGGVAVVILAVILDRITQSLGKERPAFWRMLFHKNAREPQLVTTTS